MKVVYLALLTTLLLTPFSHAVENPWNTKLPFKEATITYEMAGSMRGAEKVYVKDHGAITASYRMEPSVMYEDAEIPSELTLTTPEWIYIVNLSANSGSKQLNPKIIIQEKFDSLSTAEQEKLVKNSEKLGITVIGEMTASIEKNAGKVLGYDCDKVEAMGISAYTIAGTDFLVKVSCSIMGISEEVVDIDVSGVDAAKFALPKGVEIHGNDQADGLLRDQIDIMFTSILDGRHPSNLRQQKAGEEMMEAIKKMQQL